MKTRTILVSLLVVCLLSFLSFSLAPTDSDGDGVPDAQDQYPRRNDKKYGGTLVLAKSFEPLSLSPLESNYGDMIHTLLSEPPLMRDPWGNYVKAGWLESYDVSPDRKTWTFYLKEGVTFGDGEPLNAEALKWNFLERKKRGWRGRHFRFIPEENIKVLDEYTLQIEGTRPNPNLLFMLSTPALYGGIQTPQSFERYGEDYGLKMAYGNGPFKLEEWVKGDHMTFVRNEDYNWAPGFANNPGPPYLKRIKFVFTPEASTRVAMLRTGEVDGIVETPFERIEEIKGMEGVKVISAAAPAAYFTALNVTKPPLNEVEVRKALAYAINRTAIAEQIFYGYATPAYSLYLSAKDELTTTKHLYEYNVSKAAELLEEAGWVDQDGDGIRERDGKDLSFSLWTSNKTEFRRTGEVLQAFWREIGADVKLQRMDEATMRDRVANNEHQATVWQHLWRGLDETKWETHPENKWYPNQSGFEPPQELIEAQETASTWEEWVKANDVLSNYVYERAPIIRLVRPKFIMAVGENFKNVRVREGYWAGFPYFYNVYDAEVYKANK